MRCRIPIIYLVDSAGVNLPYQGGVFPGQYGASRIFYYNSIMRRYLRIPQLAAVMGQCIAGGAYLPALSDLHRDGEGHVVHGTRRPEPREGRHRPDDRRRDARRRGDAHRDQRRRALRDRTTTTCLAQAARARRAAPRAGAPPPRAARARRRRDPATLYDLLPADHRMSYDMHDVLAAIVDDGTLDEFQGDLAREMICGDARIDGHRRRRHREPARPHQGPRRARSRASAASSTPRAPRRSRSSSTAATGRGIPLLFVQDVSGFMVGPEAEHAGIIRAGARFVEAMATATRAEDRAHGESRVRRRLLRDGGAGLRSRFHLHLAHRPHGRDGRRVRGAGGARPGARRGEAEGEEAGVRRRRAADGRDARRLRAPARRALRRARAASSTRSSIPRRRATCSRSRCARRCRIPGRTSARSCLPAHFDDA